MFIDCLLLLIRTTRQRFGGGVDSLKLTNKYIVSDKINEQCSQCSSQVLEKHHVLRTFEVMVGEDIGLLNGLSSDSYWDFRYFHSTV